MKTGQIGMWVLGFLAAILLSACSGADGANGTNGTNGNTPPVANAGTDQRLALPGFMVALDGTGSSDVDGDTLTYSWSFNTKPIWSEAALSSTIVSRPSFTPDRAGVYVLSLVVNDGQVNSPADTITVRVGMPVPDTGQTRVYTLTFGEDGDYDSNPMSFTDNGDGTIFDNVTGLTWQKCSVGQNSDATCSGTATIHDWFAASGTADPTFNPGGADVCGNLSLSGAGWRLPKDFELMTIVDYGRWYPSINTTYFPGTPDGYYWSSTSYAPDGYFAYYLFFRDGLMSYIPKIAPYYVRCVR